MGRPTYRQYAVLAILCGSFFLCYLDRMVMASAIPFIAHDFHLSSMTMGEVLSAFFAGYALMQIPGGLLVDRFGARVMMTSSIAWWSLLTALTGLVPGLSALLWVRVLFGIGEGPSSSAAPKALSLWFAPSALGRALGVLFASSAIGATVAPLFVAGWVTHWGWRSVFYSLFVPGCALAFVVWKYVADRPPGWQEAEVKDDPVEPSTSGGYLQLLKTPAVLWCTLCAFGTHMVVWGLMNWLPTYLLQSRNFPVVKMGIFAGSANLAGAIGYPLGGYVCDKYFSANLRIPIMAGLLTGSLFTYLAAVAPTGERAVAYLLVAFLVLNIASTAIAILPLVIVPKRTAAGVYGMVNSAGQIAGFLSPLLIGALLEVTHGNFLIVLLCLVGFAGLAVIPATQIRQPTTKALKSSIPE